MTRLIVALCLSPLAALGQSGVKTSATSLLQRPIAVITESMPGGVQHRQPTAQGTLREGLLKILKDGRVPGGVVTVSGCGSPASYPTLRLGETTVGAALSGWLKNDPTYVVRLNDGAVNVLPHRGVPALLGVRVGRFGYDGRRDRVLWKLEGLPRVQQAERVLHLAQFYGGGLYSSFVPPSIHIHLANPTYLDVLNAIAVAETHGVWSYQEKRCGEETGLAVRFVTHGPTHTGGPGSGR